MVLMEGGGGIDDGSGNHPWWWVRVSRGVVIVWNILWAFVGIFGGLWAFWVGVFDKKKKKKIAKNHYYQCHDAKKRN